ncbi:hypothetical protein [Nocardioides rubriscoriae]|uniref:hypothetical protein n=1 Tax=Nocardioides rubriscoriae TaxID=642762 RepID=UPI0011E005E8|nr:hypothetical protein [Nocardioides rubriscoriae]
MDQPAVTDYRLAPAFAARLVGLGLVLLAVVAFVLTAASLALSWPADLVVVVVVVGLLAVLGTGTWLRSRAYVVRLTDSGYHVRFVRGVGVAEGRWDEVTEVSAAHPRDVPCLVLDRHDATTTSIPVEMLAADRQQFADDVRARLERAGRRRG